MKQLLSWQRIWPHLISLVAFVVLSVLYFSPVLEGKVLRQYDDIQAKAAAAEVQQYHEKTGEWSAWTNSMFGGMPAYHIVGDYPTSLPTKAGRALNNLLPAPANYILTALISAYILLLVLGVSRALSFIGAIAFAFATFSIVSIEAGHVSKMIAINYSPGVIAGVILAFRQNKWLAGSALTTLFLGLQLYGNHIQITYYLGIGLIIYVLIEAVQFIKNGETARLVKTLAGLGVACLIAVSTHTTRLWTSMEYAKETIRGKSELTNTISPEHKPGQDGLDKEYAFNWSYGISETLTLLIPNFHGGASQGALSGSSETYQVMVSRGVDPAMTSQFIKALPLYWGSQPMTSGPVYAGAIICFLFVLGLFVVKGPLKNWIAATTVLYIIWSWGKNLAFVNYLFFDYFPMFNKFRSVTMVLSLAQLLMVLLALYTLNEIFQKKISWEKLKKPMTISLGITGGLCAIFAIVPGIFFDFRAASDAQMLESLFQSTQDRNFAQTIIQAIQSDRASLLRMDAFRSLVLILFAAGIIWLWLQNKIKPVMAYSLLAVLMIFDFFGVDKRYLNNDDFVSKAVAQNSVAPSPADEMILADPALDFRVLDLSRGSSFNNAEASFFHKSIGGYHGAKLRRYQELIENQIAKPNANPGILDMLNTKYIIATDDKGQPMAQLNPGAMGNAWFVDSYFLAENADAEMAALDSLNPAKAAVLDKKFGAALEGLIIRPDSVSHIKLTDYRPDQLTYESDAATEKLAVFSEIYYNVNNDWKVTVDGQEASLLRADYVLRALRVPAGKHTIIFSFEPKSVSAGHTIDLAGSVLMVLMIAGALFLNFKKQD